eukprot:gb/GEZN01008733.1/.p1 GENE.gb/GEZN01008733.1/~~gb/GEZN01008733.1/.p1  ORF type:complete len:357 (-),score=31.00 gb/GEZN01008733.1/:273-1343(-)
MAEPHQPLPLDDIAYGPFVHDFCMRDDPVHLALKWLKFLTGIVLLPIRLLILLIAFSCTRIVCGGLGIQGDISKAPPWKQRVRYWCYRWLGSVGCIVAGFYQIKQSYRPGYDALKAASEAPILVSNHASVMDVMLLSGLYAPYFVAKEAIRKVPILGPVAVSLGCLFVDRENHSFNIATEIKKRVSSMSAVSSSSASSSSYPGYFSSAFPQLLIFPEGTVTNGIYMLKFKTGAFVPGVPVAPKLIFYSYRHASPCFESVPVLTYIRDLLSQYIQFAHVVHLPVYYPSEEEKKNPRLYADNVYQVMLTASKDYQHGNLHNGGIRGMLPSDSGYPEKKVYHDILRAEKKAASSKLKST